MAAAIAAAAAATGSVVAAVAGAAAAMAAAAAAVAAAAAALAALAATIAAAAAAMAAAAAAITAAPAATASAGTEITAPMVGTYYSAAAPGAKPFVEIGSEIAVGDTLCIIEAMKMMNQIESEVAGRIINIQLENGEPVEFGQALFIVE